MKRKKTLESAGRREWLLSIGRGSLFGLIGLGLCGLWNRNGIVVDRNTCVDPDGKIGCRKCFSLDACGHPRALSVKRIISKLEKEISTVRRPGA